MSTASPHVAKRPRITSSAYRCRINGGDRRRSAGTHETRTDQRTGRGRTVSTTAGDLELRIPELRSGRFPGGAGTARDPHLVRSTDAEHVREQLDTIAAMLGRRPRGIGKTTGPPAKRWHSLHHSAGASFWDQPICRSAILRYVKPRLPMVGMRKPRGRRHSTATGDPARSRHAVITRWLTPLAEESGCRLGTALDHPHQLRVEEFLNAQRTELTPVTGALDTSEGQLRF
jgi:hypothetical protein